MKLAPNADGLLDIVLDDDGGVVQETTFETLVLVSLLANRRANADDILPYGYQSRDGALADDRQGWVGDILDDRGRQVGSRLWLLDQELAIEETRKRAEEYTAECLQHLINDGYVSKVVQDFSKPQATRYDNRVSVYLTNGDILTLRVNYETGAIYVV